MYACMSFVHLLNSMPIHVIFSAICSCYFHLTSQSVMVNISALRYTWFQNINASKRRCVHHEHVCILYVAFITMALLSIYVCMYVCISYCNDVFLPVMMHRFYLYQTRSIFAVLWIFQKSTMLNCRGYDNLPFQHMRSALCLAAFMPAFSHAFISPWSDDSKCASEVMWIFGINCTSDLLWEL